MQKTLAVETGNKATTVYVCGHPVLLHLEVVFLGQGVVPGGGVVLSDLLEVVQR